MKILIATGIFPPEIGGPASYAREVSRFLAKNHEVTVVTYSSQLQYQEDKEFPFRVIRIWKSIPKFIRHGVYLIKLLPQVRRADKILVLNAVSAGALVAFACRLFKKKFIVRVVGDYAWEMAIQRGETNLMINDFQKLDRPGKSRLLHRIQTRTCRQAEKIIVPSSYLASLVEGWGIPREKIRVIYNGVNFKAITLAKEEARKTVGIAGNIILSVGRMVPWKGFRMLVKIMPQLLEVNPFFRLVIVGDGPDFKVLQAMSKNLGLENKVFLVGRKNQQELAVHLAAADMFVLNTGYEGFSHQILEAMTAGVPIITTAVGGNREIITQGENGFMLKYNDEVNLVEAIRSLRQVPDLQEKFIAGGKESVARFSVQKMLEETETLLTA
ncbi:MAG: glycosyltransferase family 4 protein [Candidatus Yanofskybacteria bacterium]|nr:glycosyltransferase family 4 protein [Candidatus Yanofskybacteria bacterium]